MKIKRFFAKEMRQGIRQVREALGADAVILSNTRVNGGVEIVAAVDYDESLLQAETVGQDVLSNPASAPAGKKAAPRANPFAAESSLAADSVSISSAALPELKFSTLREQQHALGEIPRNSIDQPSLASRYASAPSDNASATSSSTSSTTYHDRPAKAAGHGYERIEWSQDPAILELKNELKDMRSLLEQQLSGLAWGELTRRDPLRAKLTRCLLELGLSPTICERVADAAGKHADFDNTWRHALAILAHSLPVDSTDFLEQGGVVALVGATGVGKTTTIAKLAARYALRHGSERVAMVTTDGYRIAAHEQLRTYGRILDIPVRIANNHDELVEALKLLSDRDLVLVDTAGMSQRDIRLTEQFQLIQKSAPSIKTYLVLSSTTHRAGLREITTAFGEAKLDGCILTKLDETTSLGGALSAVMEHELPVAYVSDGQRVPEDIHIARGHSLINQAVLIAQETNQALKQESLNLAFSGMVANAHG
ncbi:MAG: flagellar biosynthesis protein FlhF [Gammaproteobacteria bacterium]|nr:flagellar biosynthesis protein FlhF [Gammaproteobacteria bacterium]